MSVAFDCAMNRHYNDTDKWRACGNSAGNKPYLNWRAYPIILYTYSLQWSGDDPADPATPSYTNEMPRTKPMVFPVVQPLRCTLYSAPCTCSSTNTQTMRIPTSQQYMTALGRCNLIRPSEQAPFSSAYPRTPSSFSGPILLCAPRFSAFPAPSPPPWPRSTSSRRNSSN